MPCSSRKRKCNGAYPCDACIGYGYVCRYRGHDRQPRPKPSPAGDSRGEIVLDSPGTSAHKSSSPIHMDTNQQVQPEPVHESNSGFLAVHSSRYVGRHSSEAFPRFLGLQLQSQVLPQLQSFAWNLEVRDTPPCNAKLAICSLISLDAARKQVRSFFLSEFPACGFLDLESLLERCEKHWTHHDQGLPFEALIGGVIGLASILAPMRSLQQETDIVKHAESILADSTVIAEPSIEILAATVLRTLYLRATATPHVTWLSGCIAMHMAEALGLHKDYDSMVRGEGEYGSRSDLWGAQARSCLFWIICAGNRLSSHELGRSPVILHGVTRKFPFPLSDKSGAAILCRLGCSLPLKDVSSESGVEQTKLAELLATVEKTSNDQPFLKLIAADVCFCLYRQIRVNNYNITKSQSQQIILIGRAAVQSANQLVQQGQPWWNMLNTLFQFTCVLISMDSLDSLVDLQDALETIDLVKNRYPGRRTTQALSTLKVLIRASRQRKEKEVACLQAVEESEQGPEGGVTDPPFGVPDDTFPEMPFEFSNWGVDDLDWIFAGAPFGRGQPLQSDFIQ
jgi:Fungal specific transcription factor domain/Fungal Zn(2)-Cys(6) binuclear cluster domain